MSRIVKPLSTEIQLGTTANTVSEASMVRLVNTGTSDRVITKKDSGGTSLGTFTILSKNVEFVSKKTDETLEQGSGTDVKATAVAILD